MSPRRNDRAKLSASAKRILNSQANEVLARLGHSEWMVQHAKREIWWWIRPRVEALSKRRPLLRGHGVVWTGAGRTELLEIEVPAAGRGEVTVRNDYTTVSPGTERAQFLSLPTARVTYPYRPGYSAAGTVISVGPGVDELTTGDRVAVIGASHVSVVTVPTERVVPLPDDVDMRSAAMATLGVIARQGIRASELQAGDSVCVFGAGVVGVLAQHLALDAGAGALTVVARSNRGERFLPKDDVVQFVSVDDGGQPPARAARVTIDATGDPQALHQAIGATADAGRIVILGSPRGVTRAFPLEELRSRGLALVGAHIATLRAESEVTGENAYAREGREFLKILRERRHFVRELLGDAIDPRDAAAAYRKLAAGQTRDVIQFDWTRLPMEERSGPARIVRLPDVRAKGLDRASPLPQRRLPRFRTTAHAAASGRSFAQLRVGLLGCGDIGRHNAAAIATATNTRLVACYDPLLPLAEDIAQKYGAEAVSEIDALLERRDVDAVFLSIPHHHHAPVAEQAAAAGKHLIVEKPPANTLAGAKAIVEAAERAGVALTICFPHRYDPHVQAARQLVQEGSLGDFRGALVQLFMDRAPSYWWGGFSGRAPSNWRASRQDAGGGVVIMNLSHYVDLIRYIAGVEASVVSSAAGFEEGMEVEESASVTVGYENGGVGSLISSTAIPGIYRETLFRIWGTDGTIELEPDSRAFSIRGLGGTTASRWQRIDAQSHEGSRARFVANFAKAIASGLAPEIGPADALATQAFIEAAYRSLDAGESVSPQRLLSEASARA